MDEKGYENHMGHLEYNLRGVLVTLFLVFAWGLPNSLVYLLFKWVGAGIYPNGDTTQFALIIAIFSYITSAAIVILLYAVSGRVRYFYMRLLVFGIILGVWLGILVRYLVRFLPINNLLYTQFVEWELAVLFLLIFSILNTALSLVTYLKSRYP